MVRQGLFECSSPGLSAMKWVVILFNLFLWALGVGMMAVGIWLYVTNNEFAVISRGQFLVGSVLMMAGGFGVIILGFLGAVGAIFESAFVLIVYMILIAIASILQVSAGSLAVNQEANLRSIVDTELRRSMVSYQPHSDFRTAYDSLHERFRCCGSNSSMNWLDASNLGMVAPDSCCMVFSQGCGNTGPQSQFYQQGCLDFLSMYQSDQLSIIGPLGLFSGLFGLLCGIFVPLGLVIMVCMNKGSYHPN